MTIKEFTALLDIRGQIVEVTGAGKNPLVVNEFTRDARLFSASFSRPSPVAGQPRTRIDGIPYWMGSGLTGAPELADVLECVRTDARSAHEYTTFGLWAQEQGYDGNVLIASRYLSPEEQATRATFKLAWRTCQLHHSLLLAWMTDPELHMFFYEVESPE